MSEVNYPDLANGLADTLNRYSAENGSNTPDFLLAEYLTDCLAAFNRAVPARDKWYGVRLRPGHYPGTAAEVDPNSIINLASLPICDDQTFRDLQSRAFAAESALAQRESELREAIIEMNSIWACADNKATSDERFRRYARQLCKTFLSRTG